MSVSSSPVQRALAALAVLGSLAGCANSPLAPAPPPVYRDELFSANAPFSRQFAGSATDACEAARRTLMGQGYIIPGRDALTIAGRKFFQPERGVGTELAFSITCAQDKAGREATVYVTAWQDHFVVKKAANSASLGVSAVGSISLPVGSSDDALVKVGVETITDPRFYERFYALLAQVLQRP